MSITLYLFYEITINFTFELLFHISEFFIFFYYASVIFSEKYAPKQHVQNKLATLNII